MAISSFMNRLELCLAGLLFTAAIAGCGRGGPEVVEIEGTVTYKGEPVPDLRIYFMPTSGRGSWGTSDEQGRFVLDYDYDHDGALVGRHTIWLVDMGQNIDPTAGMSGGGGKKKRAPEIAAVIAKHGQDKSTLQVEVKKADKNFQLKLD